MNISSGNQLQVRKPPINAMQTIKSNVSILIEGYFSFISLLS